jgi:prostaglandin-E synthase
MSKGISTPCVIWAQRHNCIFLTVEVSDAKDPVIKVEDQSVSFEALAGSGADAKQYKVVVDLFDKINPDNSAHAVRGRVTEFCLKKVDEKFWPRLTQSTEKHHWLKIDFNKWVDEDDSDDERKGGGGMPGMPGMGGMGGMGGGDYDFEEMMKSMGGLGGAGGMPGMPGGMGGMGDRPDLGNLDDEDSDDEEGAMPDLE